MKGTEMTVLTITIMSLMLFAFGGIEGSDECATSTAVLDQDHAQRLPTAKESVCRLFHRRCTGAGAVSCGRSIAHKRRESYV